MMFYDGKDLLTTLYQFVYLYEPKLYEESPILKTYIKAIHISGDLFYKMIRNTKYLSEDDFVPSVISFISYEG